MSRLTVVIPAYKPEFLSETLNSLAKQTEKNFSVFIGNDGSSDEIQEIAEKFYPILNIQYHKFDQNLGNTDLVKSWERCIDKAPKSQWYWLLSDDDIAGERCIELFFKKQSKNPDYNIFRFNINVIDQNSNIIINVPEQNEIETACEFCVRMLNNKTLNTVSEFIFSRKVYLKHGFVNFPLAWHSDYATWITFAENTGIYTIADEKVFWRKSGKNITSRTDKKISKIKLNADILFYDWIYKLMIKMNFEENYIQKITFNWFFYRLKFGNNPNINQIYKIINTIKGFSKIYIFIEILKQNKTFVFLKSWVKLFLKNKLNVRK